MKKSILAGMVMFLAVTFIVAPSCKKKVHKTNEDYIGYWIGESNTSIYSLSIEDDSQGSYEENSLGKTVTASGAVRLKKDKLKVGPFKKFEVELHPTEDGSTGEWWMILDGVPYYRTE